MKIDFNVQKLIEERIGKITPVKVFLGLAFFIIIVNVLGLILNIFNALLPFAILAIGGYYGYQFLQSRAPNQTKTVGPIIQGEAVTTQPQTDSLRRPAARPQSAAAGEQQTATRAETAAARLDDRAAAAIVDDLLAQVPAAETEDAALKVAPKIDPQTGLRQPDLERLMEKEQEALKEAKTVNDAVRAQLEERKKRLKGE
ncbi:MAG: hypothetical protein MUE40_21255 [Anaerolineae bacterium]|nr:hypothetical protein [Anaerolineae bacterium]